jgi:hypothetical protein
VYQGTVRCGSRSGLGGTLNLALDLGAYLGTGVYGGGGLRPGSEFQAGRGCTTLLAEAQATRHLSSVSPFPPSRGASHGVDIYAENDWHE